MHCIKSERALMFCQVLNIDYHNLEELAFFSLFF
jgi:hypothetical protein